MFLNDLNVVFLILLHYAYFRSKTDDISWDFTKFIFAYYLSAVLKYMEFIKPKLIILCLIFIYWDNDHFCKNWDRETNE